MSDTAPVKLVLTRPAIDALFGENPEMKVILTQQVAEHLLKKHLLKAVWNSPEFRAIEQSVRKEIKEIVTEKVGSTDYYGGIHLSQEVRTNIQKMVDKAVIDTHNQIQQKVESAVLEYLSTGQLDAVVNRIVNAEIPNIVAKRVREALKTIE